MIKNRPLDTASVPANGDFAVAFGGGYGRYRLASPDRPLVAAVRSGDFIDACFVRA